MSGEACRVLTVLAAAKGRRVWITDLFPGSLHPESDRVWDELAGAGVEVVDDEYWWRLA